MKQRHTRIFYILILSLFMLFVTGCNRHPEVDENKDIVLSIISINDFHGQLEETSDGAGAARIANFSRKSPSKSIRKKSLYFSHNFIFPIFVH